jgi:hypothetical protein
VLFSSRLFNEAHTRSADTLFPALETETFRGGGLDAHGILINTHDTRKSALHLGDMGIEFGTLGTHRDINIVHAITLRGDKRNGLGKKYLAVDTLILPRCVRKMITDVAHIGSTEKGITDSMYQHIGIGMTQKTLLMGDKYATEPK